MKSIWLLYAWMLLAGTVGAGERIISGTSSSLSAPLITNGVTSTAPTDNHCYLKGEEVPCSRHAYDQRVGTVPCENCQGVQRITIATPCSQRMREAMKAMAGHIEYLHPQLGLIVPIVAASEAQKAQWDAVMKDCVQ